MYGDWLEEVGRADDAMAVRRAPGRYLFAGAREVVFIVDLEQRAIVRQARWEHGDSRNVVVSPDARWGACGSDDGVVGVWDIDALFRSEILERHLTTPVSLSVTDQGHALTITNDRSVFVWGPDGRSARLPMEEGIFHNIEHTPDGALALVMSDSGVLRAFDARTGEPRGEARRATAERYKPFNARRFLRDGTLLMGSVSGPLTLWPLSPLGEPISFEGEAGQVCAMAVDEDRGLVVTSAFASGEEPMRVHFWNLHDRKLVRELELRGDAAQYGTAAAIVGERVIVATSEGGLLVFDLEGHLVSATQLPQNFIEHLTVVRDQLLVHVSINEVGASLYRLDAKTATFLDQVTFGQELEADARARGARVRRRGGRAVRCAARHAHAADAGRGARPRGRPPDRRWLAVATKRKDREGAPVLLRRR